MLSLQITKHDLVVVRRPTIWKRGLPLSLVSFMESQRALHASLLCPALALISVRLRPDRRAGSEDYTK